MNGKKFFYILVVMSAFIIFDYLFAARLESHLLDAPTKGNRIEMLLERDLCNALTGKLWYPSFFVDRVLAKYVVKYELKEGSCGHGVTRVLIKLKQH